MTPEQRARLIQRARGMTRGQLLALVIAMADAATPEQARVLSRAPGETMADLRAAHAELTQLTRAGRPVPVALRAADGRYRAALRQARNAATEDQDAA